MNKKPIAVFNLSEIKGETNLTVPSTGLPGFRQVLTLQIYYPERQHPLHSENFRGEKGKYKVVFTLARPGVLPRSDDSYTISENLQGDSHLAIAKPAHPYLNDEITEARLTSKISNEELTFICHPNSNGFLGKIELESIEASDYKDAMFRAFRGAAFILSELSYRYDIPLNIYQTDVIEIRTGSRSMAVTSGFKETPFWSERERLCDKEFLKYASYYREGLNSNSLGYQFLCFYKIIEGIRARRNRLIEEAKKKGEQIPQKFKESIPNQKQEQLDWLNSLFINERDWDELSLDLIFQKEVVGRTIGNLIDKKSELHKLRLKIAHSILDKGEPTLSVDDVSDVEHLVKWLPVTKFLARYLMKIEFSDRFPDKTPKAGKVRFYRSRRFNVREIDGHKEYDANTGSLEFMYELSTQILDGKVTIPPIQLNIDEEGIAMDSDDNPTVIYIAMELHDNGTEHHLYTGFYDVASNTFKMYGKNNN